MSPSKTPADKPRPTGERLQRVLADAGVASRRECEELIRLGHVEVNGETVTDLPVWVDPRTDRIAVDGKPIPRTSKLWYFLLNKPARVLTTAKDEPGMDRKTVVDLIDHPAAPRLFPVGRLDYDTVGLLLLTNDGELANRLTHPRYGVPKTYRAVVRGRIEPEAVEELENGIYLAERKEGHTRGAARTSRVELTVVHTERDKTILDITLREGRNRQVRRMLAAVGYPVKKLERTGMGPLKLKGVARGMWRELSNTEVHALRRAAAAPENEASTPAKPAGKPATKPAAKPTSRPSSRSTGRPTGKPTTERPARRPRR